MMAMKLEKKKDDAHTEGQHTTRDAKVFEEQQKSA